MKNIKKNSIYKIIITTWQQYFVQGHRSPNSIYKRKVTPTSKKITSIAPDLLDWSNETSWAFSNNEVNKKLPTEVYSVSSVK